MSVKNTLRSERGSSSSSLVAEEHARRHDHARGGKALPPIVRAALTAFAVKIEKAWIEAVSHRLDTEGSIAVIRAAAEAHRREAEHRMRQIETERDHIADKLKERDLECQALEIALDHAMMRLKAIPSPSREDESSHSLVSMESLLAERESLKDQIRSLQAQIGRLAARTLSNSHHNKNGKIVQKRSERENDLEEEISRLKRRLAHQKNWIEKARRHLERRYPVEKQRSLSLFR